MTYNTNNEMTALRRRHFLFSPGFYLPILLLAVLTPLFWFFDLDLQLQRALYQDGEWFLGGHPIFSFVYHRGNIPALLLAVGSLLIFILSFSKSRLLPYRKISAFLVLVLALGPGLVVNSLLKDQWGRPRPRNLIEFGGDYRYERPLEIDPESQGKSFPCGHASIGFYFFAPALLLFKRRKLLSCGTFVFALLYGSLIGLARMAQGGHFFSDVIWAGVLVWLVSYLLWRLMRLDIDPFYRKTQLKALKLWQKLALVIVMLLVVIGMLLATPYKRIHKPETAGLLLNTEHYDVKLELNDLYLDLAYSDSTSFGAESNGFGAPGSKLAYPASMPNRELLQIQQTRRGFFTEIESRALLVLDSLATRKLLIRAEYISGTLDLSGFVGEMEIEANEMDIDLLVGQKQAIPIKVDGGVDIQNAGISISEPSLGMGLIIKGKSGTLRLIGR